MKPGVTIRGCGSCYHAQKTIEVRKLGYGSKVDGVEGEKELEGEIPILRCHKNAPGPAGWPEVGFGDVCGDFARDGLAGRSKTYRVTVTEIQEE